MVPGHASLSDLYSDADVAISLNDRRSFFRPGITEISQFLCKRGMKSKAGYVEKGKDSNLGGIDGVFPEIGEVDESGGAGINHGGYSVIKADVRIDPVNASFVPVAVQIHQARTDTLPLEVEQLETSLGIELRS